MNLQIIIDCVGTDPRLQTAGTDSGRHNFVHLPATPSWSTPRAKPPIMTPQKMMAAQGVL